MKQHYPTLTFLTGLFLIVGVLFSHFYDSLTSNTAVASDVVVNRDQLGTSSADTTAAATGVATVTTSGSGATNTSNKSSNGSTKSTSSGSSGTSGSTGTGSSGNTGTTGGGSSAPSNTSGYKNGTYTSAYDYGTPAGIESISVTVALSNGVVTNASVQNSEDARESARYQVGFASQYSSQVVGKSIASLRLSRVSGASLTTGAFNAAIADIRSKAAA